MNWNSGFTSRILSLGWGISAERKLITTWSTNPCPFLTFSARSNVCRGSFSASLALVCFVLSWSVWPLLGFFSQDLGYSLFTLASWFSIGFLLLLLFQNLVNSWLFSLAHLGIYENEEWSNWYREVKFAAHDVQHTQSKMSVHLRP